MFSKRYNNSEQRCVALHIKCTGYDPKDVNNITQIACVELKNGKLTGNEFHTYVQPTNQEALERAEKFYEKNMEKTDAEALIAKIKKAPQFKDVQQMLMEFLGSEQNTTILSHMKVNILHPMHIEMDKEGWELFAKFPMKELRSIAAHAPQYHGGQYPAQIDKGRERFVKTTKKYTIDEICADFKVHVRTRTHYDALQDAKLIARVGTKVWDQVMPEEKAQQQAAMGR